MFQTLGILSFRVVFNLNCSNKIPSSMNIGGKTAKKSTSYGSECNADPRASFFSVSLV